MPTVLLACSTVLFAPMAYGSVHPLSLAALKTLIVSMFLISLYRYLTGRAFTLKRRYFLFASLAFILLVLLQLLPIPSMVMKVISPQRWELLFGSLKELGIAGQGSWEALSISGYATRQALNNLLFYTMLYISLLLIINNRNRIKSLAWSIIISGFAAAFLGIAQKFSGAKAIYWIGLSRDMFFGPFINANHCSAYISATAIFTFAFMAKEKDSAKKMILAFFFAIMVLATIYSLSRGGIISFIVPFCFLLYFIYRRAGSPAQLRTLYMSVFFVVAALIVLFLWWGTYRLVGDISSFEGISDSGHFRLRLWMDSLKIVGSFPLLGTGLGTYEFIIPSFVSFPGSVRFEFAENDYLQLLVETGIIGFSIVLVWLFLFFKRSARILSNPIHVIPRTRLGGMFALFALLLNSIVSFNFYVPGLMVLAVSLFALMNITTRVHK